MAQKEIARIAPTAMAVMKAICTKMTDEAMQMQKELKHREELIYKLEADLKKANDKVSIAVRPGTGNMKSIEEVSGDIAEAVAQKMFDKLFGSS